MKILICLLLLTMPALAQEWTCHQIMSMAIEGGGKYEPGTYPNAPLAGGHGSGAVADLKVSEAGNVVDVKVIDPGHDYDVGDILTAALPSGSGFKLTVGAVADFHPALIWRPTDGGVRDAKARNRAQWEKHGRNPCLMPK